MSLAEWTALARQAASRQDWRLVKAYADQILGREPIDPEGLFLSGLALKNMGQLQQAKESFAKCKKADRRRFDAPVELAEITQRFGDQGKAVALLKNVETLAENAPHYLNKAAEVYTRAGLHSQAWPLLKRAAELQPDASIIKMNKALCASKIGELEMAKALLGELLAALPGHQRLHYELSKLGKVDSDAHIKTMENLLNSNVQADEKNIFALFALGKEYEDLGEWSQAFAHYRRGNEAAWKIGQRQGYSAESEIAAIQGIAGAFGEKACAPADAIKNTGANPIFIVGLPRSGTTLIEKMITGHTNVESVDESYFLENAVKAFAGLSPRDSLQANHYNRLAGSATRSILETYLKQVDYRRTGSAYFIEKYPMNFQFLGLITRHVPDAKIIYMRRDPVDVCFALYKQPYFRFSFNVEHLADYFAAYRALEEHWAAALGERIQFVDYEELVQSPEQQLRAVMAHIGLEYSDDLLNYHQRRDASASASSAQIREKLYTSSIGKWRHWREELKPLTDRLAAHGISLSEADQP